MVRSAKVGITIRDAIEGGGWKIWIFLLHLFHAADAAIWSFRVVIKNEVTNFDR